MIDPVYSTQVGHIQQQLVLGAVDFIGLAEAATAVVFGEGQVMDGGLGAGVLLLLGVPGGGTQNIQDDRQGEGNIV